MRHFAVWMLLASSGLLWAAQQGPPPPIEHTPEPAAPARLAPGDLVEVTVFETPELTTIARLDAQGTLQMPVIGAVPLAGATPSEAERRIAAQLRATGYLLAPQVQLLVRQYAGVPVTVLGAVRNPGVYWTRQNRGLTEILAQAGGFTGDAGEAVVITHAGHGGAAPTREQVSLPALARGESDPALTLRAGDLVRVLPAAAIYVGGEVRQPGRFTLPPNGLTLLEALSLAGGIQRGAGQKRTWIVHAGAAGARRRELVNLGRIRAGRAPDPRLEPFDFVYVPANLGKLTLIRGGEVALAASMTIFTGLIIFH
ncbi:MAG TPA: polysaccharide biosynthesis/export family protein [Terriglobales bacterium]|nr:polysaccharide biosynthesis/export family protein [Terriglobales bacterium]